MACLLTDLCFCFIFFSFFCKIGLMVLNFRSLTGYTATLCTEFGTELISGGHTDIYNLSHLGLGILLYVLQSQACFYSSLEHTHTTLVFYRWVRNNSILFFLPFFVCTTTSYDTGCREQCFSAAGPILRIASEWYRSKRPDRYFFEILLSNYSV